MFIACLCPRMHRYSSFLFVVCIEIARQTDHYYSSYIVYGSFDSFPL